MHIPHPLKEAQRQGVGPDTVFQVMEAGIVKITSETASHEEPRLRTTDQTGERLPEEQRRRGARETGDRGWRSRMSVMALMDGRGEFGWSVEVPTVHRVFDERKYEDTGGHESQRCGPRQRAA